MKGVYPNMEYLNFTSVLTEQINNRLDKATSVMLHTALKNNGKERIGLTISHPGTNVFPTIYLEEFYNQYLSGRTISDIADNILSIYREIKFDTDWNVDEIQNFNTAKPLIAYKLIHLKKNESLLKSIPFVPFLDFAIVFYLLLENTERGTGCILITNEIQKSWEVDITDLYLAASLNTPGLLSAELKPMRAFIHELMHLPYQDSDETESRMYVLSNHLRYFGAACILYNHVLEDIGNMLNEDFYVLPSSIHETIILPCKFSPGAATLNNMVVEINQTQVSDEEILSDHVYYYSREKGKLLIVEKQVR